MTKKNDNYDFDLIISNEDLKANQLRESERKKVIRKKYRLRKWVKITLLLILGALIGITIYQFYILKSVNITPLGEYSCRGGLIKVCTGPRAVATYLGV